MQLSGRDITQYIIFKGGYSRSQIQPATVDLTLSNSFAYLHPDPAWIYYKRGKSPNYTTAVNDRLVLRPGQFALGSTQEYLQIPRNLAGRLEGKSTLGRLGVIVHITAGFIDPGYSGRPTLEFYNLGPRVVELQTGDAVAQLALYQMKDYSDQPELLPDIYTGHYQGDTKTQGAIWREPPRSL